MNIFAEKFKRAGTLIDKTSTDGAADIKNCQV